MAQRSVSTFGPRAHFYECPRWQQGRWWASDMRGRTVYSFSTDGEARIELEIDDRPAGLGWNRAGCLLVVSMEAKRLLELAPDGKSIAKVHELSPLLGDTEGFLNDLAVTPSGDVYIGFDSDPRRYGLDARIGKILHVTPDGTARVVAENLAFPNGIVCSLDGTSLIVAETMQPRLVSFPLREDGSLGAAAEWAVVELKRDLRAAGGTPLGERTVTLDGCAIDAEGFIWAADVGSGCLRIAPGGEIMDAVILPNGLRTFACALGGPDGRDLLICGADDNFEDRVSRREAELFMTRVDIPAA